MPVARLPLVSPSPYWRMAQQLGVVLTLALLVGLLVRPGASLHLLWDIVIPLLPASMVLNPLLWRNVCPLATLNDLGGGRRDHPMLHPTAQSFAWVIGVALLVVLVPARRFLLNGNGVALAATVAGVALLAVAAGLAFTRRAGFCNAICPVLPVEKLYGQAPLIRVGVARCADCTRCAIACPDLAGPKSAVQSVRGLARAEKRRPWFLEPYGLFACAFPGIILGYFRASDGPLASAAAVYLAVGTWALASLMIALGAALLVRPRPARALLVLGATSLATYYWFAAPRLLSALGASLTRAAPLHALVLLAAFLWMRRGWQRVAG